MSTFTASVFQRLGYSFFSNCQNYMWREEKTERKDHLWAGTPRAAGLCALCAPHSDLQAAAPHAPDSSAPVVTVVCEVTPGSQDYEPGNQEQMGPRDKQWLLGVSVCSYVCARRVPHPFSLLGTKKVVLVKERLRTVRKKMSGGWGVTLDGECGRKIPPGKQVRLERPGGRNNWNLWACEKVQDLLRGEQCGGKLTCH